MNGRIGMLGVLLGVQLIVIGAVWLARSGAGDPSPGTLFEFAPEAADELHISGADDAPSTVVVRRVDGLWQLENGLPADASKVGEVLDQLADLSAPWAVATSASARERFEVTDDNHQRHVRVRAAGETLADLYTGTSPGFQRVHARAAGDDAVFSVALSNYQLPVEADEWLDRTLLQPQGEIAALERVGGWRLERDGTAWRLDEGGTDDAEPEPEMEAGTEADVATEAALDADAAAALVRRFAELRISGTAPVPGGGVAPAAEFRITDDAGDYTLTLYGSEDDGDRQVLRSSRRADAVFALASYQAERLLEDRDALLRTEQAVGDGASPDETLPDEASPEDDAAS